MKDDISAQHVIDARGLICPQPLLKVRAATRDMPDGAAVEVWADDPQADLDLEVWCRRQGHELVEARLQEGQWRFRITIRRR